ncbi:hypothetical protein EDB19DRAFT_1831593 [Suillus lakei]|nr:hypothetical protein EDB19DRAFT_1831593 [Suillus lakei]
MESKWWAFSELWKKGTMYHGQHIMPYSTGCTTPLLNFKAGLDYKDVNDPAITITFPLVNDPSTSLLTGNSNLDLLALDISANFLVTLPPALSDHLIVTKSYATSGKCVFAITVLVKGSLSSKILKVTPEAQRNLSARQIGIIPAEMFCIRSGICTVFILDIKFYICL